MSPFPTTRRSVVLALSSDDEAERSRAFDTLVTIYWKPLYKYARVATKRSPEDTEDVVQAFFTRVLANDALAGYDASRAGFRTFLRLLFDRHAANEMKAATRVKRGGGLHRLDFESAEAELQSDGEGGMSPEDYFQREWVRNVFAVAVDRLRSESDERKFEIFEAYDIGGDVSYRTLGDRFALPETTITNYLAAMRRRFREIVLDTLREATASEQEFRAEARALLGVER